MPTDFNDPRIPSEVLQDDSKIQAPDTGVWSTVAPYLPSILLDTIHRHPDRPLPWHDSVEGSLVLADISGFTRMSERLAEVGKEGAEWLTNIINQYFHSMLDVARDHGGDNIKFGGDALLILFRGDNHAYRAVAAALSIRRATRKLTTFRVGPHRVRLSMTLGVHSGVFWSAAAGLLKRRMQYFILGQDASRVAETESAASENEVLITKATLNMLGGLCRTEPRGDVYRVLHLSKRAVARPLTEEELTPSSYLSQELLAYLPPPIAQVLRSGGQAKAIEGEHRKVSIVFINLTGINELLAEYGPAALLDELQGYLSTVVRLVDQHGGFLVGNDIYTLGLKLILIFGAPVAHEHDSANALRLALELNRELPQLNLHLSHRIGINSGFVFAGDVGPPYRKQYTVMGDAVNLAARLMSSASHNQILLSRQVAFEAGPSFVIQELPPIPVKGKKEPIPICALEAEHAVVPTKVARQAGALFGREAEVELFQRLCHEAEGGSGGTVVISGNAGVGKSRLCLEFQGHLDTRGWTVYHGACYSHTAGKPFTPWVHILNSFFNINSTDTNEVRTEKVLAITKQLRPSLLEITPLLNSLLELSIPQSDVVRSLDDETRRRRLFELITGLLKAAATDSPIVIIIEDLHWADPSSLQLVNHMGMSLQSSRFLMCLTHRPEKEMQLNLPPASTVTFSLSELPQDASLQLVKTVLDQPQLPDDIAKAILSKARGNPLFLEEVARTMRQSGAIDQLLSVPAFRLAEEMESLEIPDRIQALIMTRIDTLKATTKEVIRAAAVIGNTFDLPTLRVLLDIGPEDVHLGNQLQELIQLDLANREDAQGLTYRFKHALIKEVAYDSLLFARRRELHHRVASYLETAHRGQLEPLYEVLMHHYSQSQDNPKTRVYALKAAGKARQVFAHEEAIEYYHRGLATIEEKGVQGASQRSYFSECIGDCYEVSGHHEEAARTFLQALRQWRGAIRRSPVPPRIPLDLAEELPTKEREAVLCHKMAVSYERNSDYDSSLKWLESALQVLPPRHPRQAAKIMATKCYALYRKGLHEDAIYWGRLGLSLSRRSGDRNNLAYTYNAIASSYLETGNIKKAIRYRLLALRLYEELKDLAGQAHSNNNLGVCYQFLDQEKAFQHYKASLAYFERVGHFGNTAICHNNVGEVLLTMGYDDEAIGELQKAVEPYENNDSPPFIFGLALVNLSRAYQRKHDYGMAFECVRRGIQHLKKIGARTILTEATLQEAEIQLDSGDHKAASRTCQNSLKEAIEMGGTLLQAHGLRLMGRIYCEMQDYTQAEANLRESIALARRAGGSYEEGLSLLCLAKLYSRRMEDKSSRRRCQAALRRAATIFRRVGAEADLKQVLQVQNTLASTV